MSQPNSSLEHSLLKAASDHPTSLQALDGELEHSLMHAEVCARRQIELNDQKLRSFVIRHSVVRIHCVFALVVVLLALASVRPVRAEAVACVLVLAGSIVATSTKSISGAIGSIPTDAR